jgi:riboflavin biosynthesis pyrimidine reductase
VHVEAGASIIDELLSAGRVDALELSITEVSGGEDKVDFAKLLSYFSQQSEKIADGTRFISASK